MRRSLLVGLFCILCVDLCAQDTNSVIEGYLQASGGKDSISQLTTAVKKFKLFSFGQKDTAVTEEIEKIPYYKFTASFVSEKKQYESFSNDKGSSTHFFQIYPPVYSRPEKAEVSIAISKKIQQLFSKGKFKYLGKATVNDTSCFEVGSKSENKTYYFSDRTHLLYAIKNEELKNITYYSDYRKVGAILFPFSTETRMNGSLIFKQWYEKVEFNTKVDPKIFEFDPDALPPLRDASSRFNRIEYVNSTFENGTLHNLLKNFKGKRLMIDIWASWCGPCKSEISKYDEDFYSFLEKKKIEMLFISVDKNDKAEQWKKDVNWFNANGYHIRAGEKLNASIQEDIYRENTFLIPRYLLVDETGKIITDNLARPSSVRFRMTIESLLK
ncbi:hypothetical protein WSM22_25800 [Cytophagales bacterium WSM2-2]|nr:hypothetical protein WSM22_25800 [Cytophagales bacterium WSM2-2]